MPVELQMLAWSAVLAIAQMIVAVLGAQLQVGLPVLAGNRANMPVLEGWAGRATRAHLNMLESLVLFAIAVLVANATGHFNATTALGSTIFFWARLAYAVVYLIGFPWVRTLVWGVSLAGLLMVLSQLI